MESLSAAAQEAIDWVWDATAIHHFLRAPYHGHLKTKGPNKFVYGDQKLRGLTDPMRECFWPQEASGVARKRFYARDPAKLAPPPPMFKAPSHPSTKKPALPQSKKTFFDPAHPPSFFQPMKKPRPVGKVAPRAKNSLKQASIQALRQGSKVHRQIDQVVKLGVPEFLERNATFHPYAMAVILALHDFNPELRILHSEYLAGCPKLGIATRIDIVCVDKAGRIYIVETKTGSSTEHAWNGCNGQMRGALKDYFGNSAHNRAKVQAIAGAMLAILGTELSLGQVRCLVAHVNESPVQLTLVPDDVTATVGPIIYGALLAHQQRRRRHMPIKQEGSRNVKQEKKTTLHKSVKQDKPHNR